MEVFPAVFSAISSTFDPNKITALFASHQAPDIISSLALWLEFNPNLKCHLNCLWGTFIPHFGDNDDLFNLLADEGGTIKVDNLELQAIPAHYLHSAGNFHLYDPKARILFSGDIGAAMLPPEEDSLYVEDFNRHICHAETFHRRWMGSNTAKKNLV